MTAEEIASNTNIEIFVSPAISKSKTTESEMSLIDFTTDDVIGDLGKLQDVRRSIKNLLTLQGIREKKSKKQRHKKERKKVKDLRQKHLANKFYHTIRKKSYQKTGKKRKNIYKSTSGKREEHFDFTDSNDEKSGASVQPLQLKRNKMVKYRGIMKMKNRWNYSDAIPSFYGNQAQSKTTGGRLWKNSDQSNCFAATQCHIGPVHEKYVRNDDSGGNLKKFHDRNSQSIILQEKF